MGWLYGWRSRKELIDTLVSGNGVETVKHCLRGNNLWAVQKHEGTTFIALYLLRGGKGTDGWGYKGMDETAGPYYHNCPLGYLDLADEPEYDNAIEWRAKVRAWHANQKNKMTPGARIQYGGMQYEVIKKLHRGWEVYEPYSMRYYNMQAHQLRDATLCPPTSVQTNTSPPSPSCTASS